MKLNVSSVALWQGAGGSCLPPKFWCTGKRPPHKRPLKMPTPEKRPLRKKTTRIKDHHPRNFVVYVEEVYNELCASKKVQNDSSGAHCRVIKIQHIVQPTALITILRTTTWSDAV